MHLLKFKKYYFIDNFNPVHLKALDKNISLIWRSKYKQRNLKLISKLADFCKKYKRSLFLSNDVKLALKLKLNGAYISAHNKDFRFNNYKLKKNFKIIGSAHNIKELNLKIIQGCSYFIFSRLFETNYKNKPGYLGIIKFYLFREFSFMIYIFSLRKI